MTPQWQHWKHYKAHIIAYDITIQKFAKLLDVSSFACKIKFLNSHIKELEKLNITYNHYTIATKRSSRWQNFREAKHNYDNNYWELLLTLSSFPHQVVSDMEKVRQTLVNPSNMRVHMTANVTSLANEISAPQSPWLQFLDSPSGDQMRYLEYPSYLSLCWSQKLLTWNICSRAWHAWSLGQVHFQNAIPFD